jgi:uncharacterized protein YndB with AHSA1/START domain
VGAQDRVEIQTEVTAKRDEIFPLLATADGLAHWLEAVEMEPEVGAPVRFRLHDAVAVGKVLALDPPQHISFSWDWEDEPIGAPTVLALDAIDHGARTHLTLRHVGFPSRRLSDEHEAMWVHWFDRLKAAALEVGERVGRDPKGPQAT